MLSNAYFLAKFRFDTAENEPAKNLQNFTNFANFATLIPPPVCNATGLQAAARARRRRRRELPQTAEGRGDPREDECGGVPSGPSSTGLSLMSQNSATRKSWRPSNFAI